ncbi:glycoside hydrolase domain-containing protein [Penaeicola halotolerans]|uniref:glycoside hydrolase domain-containing protein n=1 Tax=Penaeicola halotolerans TaxID=2793196 RepID=UPI001CF7F7E7|nr:glycoside hydrolase domain-containing protein [Penaeicola halotolerans]
MKYYTIFLFYFFSVTVLSAQSLDLTLQNPYLNEKVKDSNLNFDVWRGEFLPIIIKLNSALGDSIHFTFNSNINYSIDIYHLNYVLADLSAGFCGVDKQNGVFPVKKVPERALRLENNMFLPDTITNYILLNIKINKDAKKIKHTLQLDVFQNGISKSKSLSLNVIKRKRINISSLDFTLDFWQFPISVADYYAVEPWSTLHYDYLDTMFDQLKNINQRVVTTSVFWDPYNRKIRDLSHMMIQVKKSKSDTYSFDYKNFDKYVQSAIDKGVGENISLHNLYPWNNYFFYFDENLNEVIGFNTSVNSKDYQEFWGAFLLSFEKHLESNDWLDKVIFYIDERDIESSITLCKFIHSYNKSFRIGYAGAFDERLSDYIYDYSVPSNIMIPNNVLEKRQREGKRTTFYTACFGSGANMLMTSPNYDIPFLLNLALAKGYDGKLRWAFNYWSSNIMDNAIYSDVPSGDAHFVYPYNQPSLRYFLIVDSLEDLQKISFIKSNKKRKKLLLDFLNPTLLYSEKERQNLVLETKKRLNEK